MINCREEVVLHHRPFGLNKTGTCLSRASNILIYGHRPKVGGAVKIRFKFAKKRANFKCLIISLGVVHILRNQFLAFFTPLRNQP